jgi:hypothetical protein
MKELANIAEAMDAEQAARWTASRFTIEQIEKYILVLENKKPRYREQYASTLVKYRRALEIKQGK